jgi:hypothetical protein
MDLGTYSRHAGVKRIKYATLVASDWEPRIVYDNPFLEGTVLGPVDALAWYAEYPLRGAATAALHVFNVLDQDFPFPYVTSLTPPYYPAVALVGHLLLAIGVAGLIAVAFDRRASTPVIRDAARLLLIGIVAHLAVHATVQGEARYGLPVLVAIFPFAIPGADVILRATSWRRAVLIASILAWLAFAGWLSTWVHRQSPAIRAAEALARGPAASDAWRDWNPGAAPATSAGEAVLCACRPGGHTIVRDLRASTGETVTVRFSAVALGPAGAPLTVALQNEGAVDIAAQTVTVHALERQPVALDLAATGPASILAIRTASPANLLVSRPVVSLRQPASPARQPAHTPGIR